MINLPDGTELTGSFNIGLIDEDGAVVATRTCSFNTITHEGIEYLFAAKGRELSGDYISIWLKEQSA